MIDLVRHTAGLLDTSTVIQLSRVADPSSLPSQPLVSAVTLAELSVGLLVAGSGGERAARQAHLQQAESDSDVLPFDAIAARAFGRVAASLRESGRKPAARSFDAMIAATALAHGLPVYTCNRDDFAHFEGLEVVVVRLEQQGSAALGRPKQIALMRNMGAGYTTRIPEVDAHSPTT